MSITLHKICKSLQIYFPENGEDFVISAPAKIEEAQEGEISFLANEKYKHHIYETKAKVVICHENFVPEKPVNAILLKVDDPYTAFSKVLTIFQKADQKFKDIHASAVILPSASIGKKVSVDALSFIGEQSVVGDYTYIYPQVYIGNNVQVGKNCILYAGVKILDHCVVGDNCILHPGVVVGSDGFGFTPQKDGSFQKIPQLGNVLIEDNVEIGANTTIDRATLGSTIIRKGVKLDNLVQIAHNVEIGENTVIASQAGVSGSTKLGHNVMVGGQAGFVGHITIAPYTMINAQSGVSKSVKENAKKLTGSPAIDFTEAYRAYSVFRKLPEMEQKLKDLQEVISLLTNSSKPQ